MLSVQKLADEVGWAVLVGLQDLGILRVNKVYVGSELGGRLLSLLVEVSLFLKLEFKGGQALFKGVNCLGLWKEKRLKKLAFAIEI